MAPEGANKPVSPTGIDTRLALPGFYSQIPRRPQAATARASHTSQRPHNITVPHRTPRDRSAAHG